MDEVPTFEDVTGIQGSSEANMYMELDPTKKILVHAAQQSPLIPFTGTREVLDTHEASQRRKNNTIKCVEDPQGREVTEQAAIGDVHWLFLLPFYYFSTYQSQGMYINNGYHTAVEMKDWIMHPFTREEVKTVVFQMNPLGLLGPNGFSAQFYQQHWEVVGEEVSNYALQVLNQGGSLTESAFVPGRVITNNILVAYEVLHSMDSRMKGKRGFMALKLNMSKAYDMVEWSFVEAVMIKMEFPPQWINLIQTYLTSVSYSILVNGEPQKKFLPSSPIGRGPITVNHFFFVDDSLLFCQANTEQLSCVFNILALYEKALGQALNKEESSIFFSKNTKQATQQQILEMARVTPSGSFERYLGLPVLVGRAKIAASILSLIELGLE
ncbi:hypothetical protein F2P56_024593 [Juglans regia]|uniref:Reverse transcriptase n=2 Tax=Juglans regia TaxID=51240 RepID=A0A833UC29_JUGRE|nr:uncharacterized protein LOC109018053 [Juglans regia]KAF5454968.1 hypothetical protein F2P56_024593 [Juglans regia]